MCSYEVGSFLLKESGKKVGDFEEKKSKEFEEQYDLMKLENVQIKQQINIELISW